MSALTDEMRTLPKTKYMIILGDFNLDSAKKTNQDYNQHHVYRILDDFIYEQGYIQIDSDSTWSRIVKNQIQESTLDHIYTNDLMIVKKISNMKQAISDHNLISISINLLYEKNKSDKKIVVQD